MPAPVWRGRPRPRKYLPPENPGNKEAVGSERNKNVTTKSTLTAIGSKPLPDDTHSCWSCGAMRAAHFCALLRKGAATRAGGLLHILRPAAEAEPQRRSARKRFLRTQPQASSRPERPRRQPGTGMEPRSKARCSMTPTALFATPSSAPQYLLHLEGVDLEEQSKDRHRAGSRHRRSEEADRPSRPSRRSLRTQHAARRTSYEQEDGRRRSEPDKRNRRPQGRPGSQARRVVTGIAKVLDRLG